MTDSERTYSWGDLLRDGRAVYTISLTLAVSLHAMDAFIVATVLPSLIRAIGGAPGSDRAMAAS